MDPASDGRVTQPAWRDPRYLSELRVRQLEAHELAIREREWELAERRMQALRPTAHDRWSDDFQGCVE